MAPYACRRRAALAASALVACAGGEQRNDDAPSAPTRGPRPLLRAHAHNDSWHDRPLLDALDLGFASVEADVFLVGDALLVGHTPLELRPWKSLERLYLEPLAQRVRANGGRVYRDDAPFLLWIDVKHRGAQTYAALRLLLQRFADLFVREVAGVHVAGPVQVILTGKRPFPEVRDDEPRLATVDAGIDTLGRGVPAYVAPFVSASWRARFTWRGVGPFPAEERARLRALVAQVHAEGKRLRFWATPEEDALWEELHRAGVDLLSTDDLARLARFLESRGDRTATPAIAPRISPR